MNQGKIRLLFKVTAWLLFAWGTLVFIALPTRRYGWMQQMDPSIAMPPDANAGNGTLFVLLLLAAIVATQVAIMATAKSRRERMFAVALVVAAVALWASRFWR